MDVNLGDIFSFCNNVKDMYEFYSGIIGWKYIHYSEEQGYLTYKINDAIFFVIMEGKEPLPVDKKWAKGPAFQEGTSYARSWTIKVENIENYREIVSKFKSKATCYYENPVWTGNYWSFMVKDPMGFKLDIYFEPSEKPENTIW